jgi:hypothetical protein
LQIALPFQVAGNRVLAASTKGTVIRTTVAGAQQTAAVKSNAMPTKQIAIAASPSTAIQQKGTGDIPQSPAKPPQQHVMIRQQIAGTQVMQKVTAQPGTVVVSGGQVFAPGQIVVSGSQVIGSPTQVSFLNILRYFGAMILWRLVRGSNMRLERLHNEVLHNSYSSPDVVRAIKSGR